MVVHAARPRLLRGAKLSEREQNGLRWQIQDLDRRIANIERAEVAVIANRLAGVERRLDGLTKAAWTIALALLSGGVSLIIALASGALG